MKNNNAHIVQFINVMVKLTSEGCLSVIQRETSMHIKCISSEIVINCL